MVTNRFMAAVCIAFLIWGGAVYAGDVAPLDRPCVVIHHLPQKSDRSVLKWDCPVLVTYADGTIIWRRQWASSIDAFRTASAPGKVRDLKRSFESLGRRYAGKTFTLTESSDPEITTVWVFGNKFTVLGDWKAPRVLHGSDPEAAANISRANDQEKRLWASLPTEVHAVLATVANFEDANGTPWRPEKLELLLQPPSRTRVEPVQWPRDWPRSFAAAPRTASMITMNLPGGMLDELLRLLPNDGEPKAVSLDGETRYAEIHFVLPGQAAWSAQQ